MKVRIATHFSGLRANIQAVPIRGSAFALKGVGRYAVAGYFPALALLF
jgi:hypothetical protein